MNIDAVNRFDSDPKLGLLGDTSRPVAALFDHLESFCSTLRCQNFRAALSALQTRHYDALLLGREPSSRAFADLRGEADALGLPILFVASEADFQPDLLSFSPSGIVEPSVPFENFQNLLRLAREGVFVAPAWLHLRLAQLVSSAYTFHREEMIRDTGLTSMEVQVLDLLAQHLENKEIASALSISASLTQKLVLSAYRKLGVSRRTEAAVLWSRLRP